MASKTSFKAVSIFVLFFLLIITFLAVPKIDARKLEEEQNEKPVKVDDHEVVNDKKELGEMKNLPPLFPNIPGIPFPDMPGIPFPQFPFPPPVDIPNVPPLPDFPLPDFPLPPFPFPPNPFLNPPPA